MPGQPASLPRPHQLAWIFALGCGGAWFGAQLIRVREAAGFYANHPK